MNPDSAFDAYLARHLDEAALPDLDFTRAVLARMEQHRRRRRLALAAAVVGAALLTVITAFSSPRPWVLPAISPQAVGATLLLAAACCLAWIGAEPGPRTTIQTRGQVLK
jgi:peptidoglycan/LPS O-acetylase OafA/YrhL